MSEVRLATIKDKENLLKLCTMLHSENALFPMDEQLVSDKLDHALTAKGGIIGVIGTAGDLEACIYLELARLWYTRDFHLEEFWSFVRPDKRQSQHAKNLIAFAKKTTEQLRIPLLIGIVSNHRTEAKCRLYQRQLPKAGEYFLYNYNSEKTLTDG